MPRGSPISPCDPEKNSKNYLKAFEMPKCHGDTLWFVRPRKKCSKNILKYLKCLNALGSPMFPWGPKILFLKLKIFEVPKCPGGLFVPVQTQKVSKNYWKLFEVPICPGDSPRHRMAPKKYFKIFYSSCLNALEIPYVPCGPENKF